MVTTNAHVKSAGVAVKVLKKLTPISVCESQLMELTGTVGAGLAADRDQQTADYLAGTLKPQIQQTPQVAAVGTDGGRIFTRAEAGRGVHQPAWKETKIACLQTMQSETFDVDPHPELPGCFADPANVAKVVREIKSIRNAKSASPDDGAGHAGDDASPTESNLWESLILPPESAMDAASNGSEDDRRQAACPEKPKRKNWRPRRVVRTCVGSVCSSDEFGPKVAAEAQRRNFFAAPRRAYLGDGSQWIWTLQQRYFPTFEPITDFVHPVTYIFESSRVVAGEGEQWALCVRWLTDCWQGRVSQVLDELRRWQTLHPSPPDEKLPNSDGRAIVSAAITYLSNNASRMNYPKYRQAGLPVTSAMVESLVKEFNYRVKGTEKAWNRGSRERGCEPILEVRNAVLCDDRDRLSEFILSRPGSAFYRPSTAKHASKSNATAA